MDRPVVTLKSDGNLKYMKPVQYGSEMNKQHMWGSITESYPGHANDEVKQS